MGDGFAFVIQADLAGPQALGESSSGIGYAGLYNALALEFDTFQVCDCVCVCVCVCERV